MDKPFSGVGTTGYDNTKKKFVGTWIDSMSTGIMRSEGTADPTGKVITAQAVGSDPLTGKESRTRIVEKWEGDTKKVEEFFEKKERQRGQDDGDRLHQGQVGRPGGKPSSPSAHQSRPSVNRRGHP